MKTFRMIGCILAVVCLCFGMSSCSEDEEGGGNNNCSVKLGDKSFSTPYAFYWVTEEGGKHDGVFAFFSFNPKSGGIPTGQVSMVAIEFTLPDGTTDIRSTVIKGENYKAEVVHGNSFDSTGEMVVGSYRIRRSSNTPDMKIVRDGNNFNISIEGATAERADESQKYNFSFNYSGNITNQQIMF